MKKFFYSIITMFLSFNMMNPTFVKASEKREIKSNKNIIIIYPINNEKDYFEKICSAGRKVGRQSEEGPGLCDFFRGGTA